jgi:hypothetical protein
MEIQNAMAQRIYDMRAQLANSAMALKEYLSVNPTISELYHDPE